MGNIFKVEFVEMNDNVGLTERKTSRFCFQLIIVDIINQKKEFRRKSRFEEKTINFISFYQF